MVVNRAESGEVLSVRLERFDHVVEIFGRVASRECFGDEDVRVNRQLAAKLKASVKQFGLLHHLSESSTTFTGDEAKIVHNEMNQYLFEEQYGNGMGEQAVVVDQPVPLYQVEEQPELALVAS